MQMVSLGLSVVEPFNYAFIVQNHLNDLKICGNCLLSHLTVCVVKRHSEQNINIVHIASILISI